MGKEIIGQLAYYQTSRRYLSGSYSNKFLALWNLSPRNNSVVFEKATSNNIVLGKKIIGQLAYYQTSRWYLSSLYSNKFLTLWNLSPRTNSVVFEKATSNDIAFYPCLKNENQQLVKENVLVCFWQIYQRTLTVCLTNFHLQNWMRMVLV